MCPEGNDLSETYRMPAHIPGATAVPVDMAPSPAGVHICVHAPPPLNILADLPSLCRLHNSHSSLRTGLPARLFHPICSQGEVLQGLCRIH